MRFVTPLVVAAVTTAVSASPIEARADGAVSVPLTYKMTAKNVQSIVVKGQQKIATVNKKKGSGTVTNELVSYIATVNIGGKDQLLIVDTGSSNTWCGAAGTSCEPTANGTATGGTISVTYGSGQFSGDEYIDAVTFGGKTVNKQSVGSALQSSGFSGVNGILGLGPVVLTTGTVSNTNTVPTFMNNLAANGKIPKEVLGVSFLPLHGSDIKTANGLLTLGGVDKTRFSGTIKYAPVTKTGTSQFYWGIDVAAFNYGNTTLGNGTGIVDTGTTLIYLPDAVYTAFLAASGGTAGSSGVVEFNKEPTEDLVFTFGSNSFALTPAQYLIPKAEYGYLGLTPARKYFAWITNGGTGAVNCIIGQKFLENYYSVYDTTNDRIGFAPAKAPAS